MSKVLFLAELQKNQFFLVASRKTSLNREYLKDLVEWDFLQAKNEINYQEQEGGFCALVLWEKDSWDRTIIYSINQEEALKLWTQPYPALSIIIKMVGWKQLSSSCHS